MTTTNPDEVVRRLRALQKAIGDCPACFRALYKAGVFSLTTLDDAIESLTAKPVDEAGVPEPDRLAMVEQCVRQRLADLYIMEAPPSAIRDAVARTAALAALSVTTIPAPDRDAITVPRWLAEDILKFAEANAEIPSRETLVPIGAINAFRAAIVNAILNK